MAQAGGWATVELGEAPSGLVAGKPWRVELIVKQHGITPMADVKPSITIVNDAGVVAHVPRAPDRPASATTSPTCTFPSAGTWRARISDGFTDVTPHRISTLNVASATAAPGGFPWQQTVAIAIVALLWMGGWFALYGRLHPHPRQSVLDPRVR